MRVEDGESTRRRPPPPSEVLAHLVRGNESLGVDVLQERLSVVRLVFLDAEDRWAGRLVAVVKVLAVRHRGPLRCDQRVAQTQVLQEPDVLRAHPTRDLQGDARASMGAPTRRHPRHVADARPTTPQRPRDANEIDRDRGIGSEHCGPTRVCVVWCFCTATVSSNGGALSSHGVQSVPPTGMTPRMAVASATRKELCN